MHRSVSVVAALAFAVAAAALAVMRVDRAVVCTGVEDREPVGAAESFPADVGSLTCYTELSGAAGDTEVVHVWYYGVEEKARIPLPVRASHWRTWSRKSIPPAWTGPWRVVVEDADGNRLTEVSFTVGR